LKIGLDAKRAFTNHSGLGNYSRELIDSLKEYSELNLNLFTTEKNSQIFNPKNINIYTPKIKIFKNYWRQYQIGKILNKENITIYHGLSNEIPRNLSKKVKSIVTIHDLIHIKYPEFYNLIDRKIYYQKSKYACKNANKIIAISQQTKEDIIKYFKIEEEKIRVIYQGCHSYFKKADKKSSILKKYGINKPFILYVGTIEERKNLKLIIQAVKDLKEVNLVCIGKKTNYYNKIIKYIKKENVKNNILFPKVDNMQDLSYIYKESKGLVNPSIYEGFGKPIVEAMYSRIPVILTDTKIFKEVGGPYSYYFKPNNKEQLIKLINKIWNPTVDVNENIEKSRFFAEKFNNKIHAKKIFEIYKEIDSLISFCIKHSASL